ncbi:hypothetical protein [Nocardioides sp. B-3]|uniref:hypothetical protein n=1 Tax=Nocardioides sp. B-3 TaxID=2895565 RepID=UPI0021524B39|nr:hypothetical protein [Nocardioides sp. B-3]UUZ58059.1 hypothetical protein LP418_17365 [Nocardioides sp. B-3]
MAVAEGGYVVDGGPGDDSGLLSSPVLDSFSTECCPQGGTAVFDEATGAREVSFFAGRVSSAAVSSTGTAVGLEDVTPGDEFCPGPTRAPTVPTSSSAATTSRCTPPCSAATTSSPGPARPTPSTAATATTGASGSPRRTPSPGSRRRPGPS